MKVYTYHTREALGFLSRISIGVLGIGLFVMPGIGVAGADEDGEPEEQSLREQLTEREDETRVETPLVLDLFGNPLALYGQYEVALESLDHVPVGGSQREYGELLFEQEVELEAFYRIGHALFLFAQGRIIIEKELDSDSPDTFSNTFVERGEMWLNVPEIGGSPFSIEVGRLDFEDDRLWWWDEDLDAIRLIYELDTFDIEVSAARELSPARLDQDRMDPDEMDLFRIIVEMSWDWSENHGIQLFGLHHDDRSGTEAVDTIIRQSREDESDAGLTWIGLRVSGAWDMDGWGLLGYWVDAARVSGDEVLIETGDGTDEDEEGDDEDEDEEAEPLPAGHVIVEERLRRDVGGWAIDVGATWALPLPAQPRFTVGYARGSGDRHPDHGDDESFRQTGLHGNEPGYGGVQRFQGYGEILDPELSNLSILTAGIGCTLLESSSIDLVYHHYGLVEYAESLRDARLEVDLTGAHHDLGEGLDLILGLEEWDRVEFELSFSLFRAGDAFGAARDEWNHGSFVSFRFAF